MGFKYYSFLQTNTNLLQKLMELQYGISDL